MQTYQIGTSDSNSCKYNKECKLFCVNTNAKVLQVSENVK